MQPNYLITIEIKKKSIVSGLLLCVVIKKDGRKIRINRYFLYLYMFIYMYKKKVFIQLQKNVKLTYWQTAFEWPLSNVNEYIHYRDKKQT